LYKRHSQLLTLCFVCLRFVYLMLSVFLYSTFLIAPLVSSHIYCVPIRSQDLDFQRHMSWFFHMFSELRCDRWLLVLLILVKLMTITV
jgi:hypothetical protein